MFSPAIREDSRSFQNIFRFYVFHRLCQDKSKNKRRRTGMRISKLIKISIGMLKLLSENGIRIDDWQYVDVYEDFLNMRKNKVKYRVAIKMLADEKHISQRTLERAFKRLSRIVN
jgi:hypothetical protein